MIHDTDTVTSAKSKLPFLVDTKQYIDAPLRQSCDAKKIGKVPVAQEDLTFL